MSAELLNLVFEAPFIDFCLGYSLLEIALIADQDYHGLISLHFAEVVPLLLDIFERALTGKIEHHQDAVASLEVC